ncbi:glutamate racemase [Patescibacteria group bacterium]|nr:glutamate racemase [Patescibacteria group bacterium]
MNIGVFDSGLGGLTILKSIIKEMPEYSYVYLGDNARVPYGNRSPEIIYEFTKQALDFLFKKNCRLVVIACNTSTSTSLRRIQHEYLPRFFPDRKVLGVVKPAVEEISSHGYKRIGIIGTKATVNSQAFVREVKKVLPQADVYQQACPLLVPYIEDSGRNQSVLRLILKEYLAGLEEKKIDSLLLACTHYEIVEKEIEQEVGPSVKVISEGKIVAKKLKDYLLRHQEVGKDLQKERKVSYYVTDLNPDYQQLMKLFLGHLLEESQVHHVKIDQ